MSVLPSIRAYLAVLHRSDQDNRGAPACKLAREDEWQRRFTHPVPLSMTTGGFSEAHDAIPAPEADEADAAAAMEETASHNTDTVLATTSSL
jgi:hypothetical protein